MRMQRFLATVLFFGALLGAWEAVVRAGWYSSVLVPSPLSVAHYLREAAGDGTLFTAMGVTMRRLLIGFGLGLAAGIPLGMLTARVEMARATVGILALGLQTLPSVCWVPLALIWFGQNESAMLFVVVMGTLWSVLIAVSDGMRTVPPIYARAARTMGSRGLHTLVTVTLPASLPHLVAGMKQGWAFAWRSLMAAEIYVTIVTGLGLGQLLHYGRELNAMDQVIGVMLLIVAIGLVADRVLFSPLERFLRVRWGLEAK